MKLVTRVAAIAAASILVLTGCTNSEEDVTAVGESVESSASSAAESATRSAASYPVTVEHKQGSTEIPAEPERIVVLEYSSMDYLDALGLGDKIVGVPSQNAAPTIAQKYSDVEGLGSLPQPDIEKVAALEPDLIFLGSRNAKTYEDMSKIAPTVDLSFGQQSAVEDTKSNALLVGKIFGAEDEMQTKIDELDAKMEAAKKKITDADATALVVMASGGELTAFGEGSRFALIHDLGFKPAADVKAEGRHGEAISFEYIADANPDYLFVIDRDVAVSSQGNSAEATLDNDLVKGTNAAKNDHIVYLDPSDWYLVGSGVTTFSSMIDEVSDAV